MSAIGERPLGSCGVLGYRRDPAKPEDLYGHLADPAPRQTPYEMVREFHEAFGHPVSTIPSVHQVSPELADLRLKLIYEEHIEELVPAVVAGDIIEIADALGDIVYVVAGMALVYGIDLDAVFAEIHRSNMAKLGPDGEVIRRADGKVLKPEGWQPPDIAGVLGIDR